MALKEIYCAECLDWALVYEDQRPESWAAAALESITHRMRCGPPEVRAAAVELVLRMTTEGVDDASR